MLEQFTSSFEAVTVPLSQPIYENGTIMAESTKEDPKKSEPKHAAPKPTRAERRKQSRQGWASMSRGSEHHEH